VRNKFELGTLIAERLIEFEAKTGVRTPVAVRIGRPIVHEREPHELWVCPFQIEGLGSSEVRGCFGIDAMQALLLCVHIIPADLGHHLRAEGGRFLYLGEPDSSFVASCRTVLQYSGDVFPEREP
jgi:hypothetical protein